MNFNSERNKPLFIVRKTRMFSLNASFVNEALANETVVRSTAADDYLVKAAAARRIPYTTLVTVDDATPSEIKDLVVRRLQTDSSEKFQFLDGREFTGPEAAAEVRKSSEVGEYFLDLEKETLRIAQRAHFNGEL